MGKGRRDLSTTYAVHLSVGKESEIVSVFSGLFGHKVLMDTPTRAVQPRNLSS